MTVLAVNVELDKNHGVGSQLTLLKGTLTVTVTGAPEAAVEGSVGLSVIVAPEIDALLRYVVTVVFTDVVVAPSKTAARAPSLAALVITCSTMMAPPKFDHSKYQQNKHRRDPPEIRRRQPLVVFFGQTGTVPLGFLELPA